MNAIYIVDDDSSVLESLSATLRTDGHVVETFLDPIQFVNRCRVAPPAVAILDIFFSEGEPTGDQLIVQIRDSAPLTQCIVISGESDIQKTVACLRNGAVDFLEKPVSLPRLLTTVRNALGMHAVATDAHTRHRIIGESQVMQGVRTRIRKLAALNESVLIFGENGTGKELVAENLHLFSPRSMHHLHKVNCAALNPNLVESELFGHKSGSFTGADRDKQGCFERAHRSTLFLDEIGDFASGLQSKLLRVLQDRRVMPVGGVREIECDTRMVFATNRDLEAMVREGGFREDLYFRISTFVVRIPPLRDRPGDIPVLAQHFLNAFLAENKLPGRSFHPSALDRLAQYHYPGNVRELAKIVKNAAFFTEGETITGDAIDFSPPIGHSDLWFRTRELSLADARDYFERELITRRLKVMGNDIGTTAESLGMIKNNLYRKLKQCGIELGTLPS